MRQMEELKSENHESFGEVAYSEKCKNKKQEKTALIASVTVNLNLPTGPWLLTQHKEKHLTSESHLDVTATAETGNLALPALLVW